MAAEYRGGPFQIPRWLEPGSIQTIARRHHVDRRTAVRWRTQGMSYWQADRFAAAYNMHPCLIWPDWWHLTACEVARDLAHLTAKRTPAEVSEIIDHLRTHQAVPEYRRYA